MAGFEWRDLAVAAPILAFPLTLLVINWTTRSERKTLRTLLKRRPILHVRGLTVKYYDSYCANSGCTRLAHYLDQDARYWCERHLPEDTIVADRASGGYNEICTVHGALCAPAWDIRYRQPRREPEDRDTEDSEETIH